MHRPRPAPSYGHIIFNTIALVTASVQVFRPLLVTETGSSFGKAMFEASLISVALRQAASLTTADIGEVMPSNVPGKINRTIRRAKGMVGVISVWSFPFYRSVRGFAYALVLGNAIVLKSSEDSPLSGDLVLADLPTDADVPAGVFNVITTSRDGAAICRPTKSSARARSTMPSWRDPWPRPASFVPRRRASRPR